MASLILLVPIYCAIAIVQQDHPIRLCAMLFLEPKSVRSTRKACFISSEKYYVSLILEQGECSFSPFVFILTNTQVPRPSVPQTRVAASR